MKITKVRAIPMSDPVPPERRHRTDLGTKMKSDATLILVETDKGLSGMGAALGTPPVVVAIVEHELAPEVVGEDPLFSERIFEKMYNGSHARPALERVVPQGFSAVKMRVVGRDDSRSRLELPRKQSCRALEPYAVGGTSIR